MAALRYALDCWHACIVVVDVISRSTDPVGRLGGVPLQVAIAKTLKLSCQLSCFVDPSRMHARTTVTWSVCGGWSSSQRYKERQTTAQGR